MGRAKGVIVKLPENMVSECQDLVFGEKQQLRQWYDLVNIAQHEISTIGRKPFCTGCARNACEGGQRKLWTEAKYNNKYSKSEDIPYKILKIDMKSFANPKNFKTLKQSISIRDQEKKDGKIQAARYTYNKFQCNKCGFNYKISEYPEMVEVDKTGRVIKVL